MSNKKYQIKTKHGVSHFVKKGEFINQCQSYFNENLSAKKKTEILFSYDSGVNWLSISEFKEHRQTIQNEKIHQEVNVNYSIKKNKSTTSWFNKILYLIITLGVIFYFIGSSNSELDNTQNKDIHEKSINDVPLDENIDNNTNETKDEGFQSEQNNLNENNVEPQKQESEPQWVNCSECHGRGEIVCRECNGTTLSFCGTCHGRGTFNSGNGTETCYYCKGALKLKCTRCYGKGTEGSCRRCGGRGQIQE